MGKAIRTVGLLLLLQGCQLVHWPGAEHVTFVDPAVMASAVRPPSVACYRTLGRVDCHSVVLPAEEHRRVGYFHADVLAY